MKQKKSRSMEIEGSKDKDDFYEFGGILNYYNQDFFVVSFQKHAILSYCYTSLVLNCSVKLLHRNFPKIASNPKTRIWIILC